MTKRYLFFCPSCKCETYGFEIDPNFCGDCSDPPDPSKDVEFVLYAIVEDGVRMIVTTTYER